MPKKRRKSPPSKISVEVVEARSFVLTDAYGTERARLQCLDANDDRPIGTLFRITDYRRAMPQLEVMVDDTQAAIRIYDKNGNTLASVVTDERGSYLTLHSEGREHGIIVGAPSEESVKNEASVEAADIWFSEAGTKSYWSLRGTLSRSPS